FATERGRAGYDKYRRDFAKLIWRIASPKWAFDDATFDRTAASFDNPDHVAIVIHNYRSKAMPMARHTRSPDPMPANSPASIRTELSKVALATICLRKPRGTLLR